MRTNAQFIKKIFERASQYWTYEEIVDAVNKEGYRSTSMKNQKGEEIGNKPMVKSIVGRMLRNPFYAGYITYQGELIKGKHEAIITLELFNEAQQTLLNRGIQTKRPRRKAGEYSFASLFDCACGGKFTAEQKTRFKVSCCQKRITRREMPEICPYCKTKIEKSDWNKGKTYKYLKCSRRCGQRKHVKETEIQAFILARIQELDFTEEHLEYMDSIANEYLQKESQTKAEQLKTYAKELKDLQTRQSRLVDMRINGEIENSVFQGKQQEIQNRILEIEDSKEKLNSKTNNRLKFLENTKNLKDRMIKVFSSSSQRLKKQLLNELFKVCHFENGELVWEWQEEWAEILNYS